jgi:hypothetical protein
MNDKSKLQDRVKRKMLTNQIQMPSNDIIFALIQKTIGQFIRINSDWCGSIVVN